MSGSKPVLGSLADLKDPVTFLTRVRRECGDVGRFKILGRDMVLFSGSEAQAAFFRAPDDQLSPKDAYQKMMAPIFGAGVVYDAPTAHAMSEHIAMTFPALTEKRLRSYFDTIVSEAESSLTAWGDEGTLDVLDYTKGVTLRIAAGTLLGPEIRARLSSDFAPLYRDLERGITPIAFVAPWLPIPAFRRRDAALRGLQAAFADIVAQRRERGWRGEDFLQTLMETRYQDGRRLSDDEITGLLIAMLFAGHHTSSATLAWTIIELLQNPQHLESLRAELVGVSGEDGLVTFQSLKNTPQLDDFVHEVLRLHPPLFMLIRKVVTEFAYGDYRIQAGAYAVASPAVSHSIPEMFTAPDQFDPDRYGPGREEDKTPNALISFGGGHHRCPGMRFGLLQVKAIVAVLLRAFELVPEQQLARPDFTGLVVAPQQPYRLRYRRLT